MTAKRLSERADFSPVLGVVPLMHCFGIALVALSDLARASCCGPASIAISLTTSHAGVTFSAPGLENPYTTPELNVQLLLQTAPTSEYWKYKITGYEYQLEAAPLSGDNTFLGKTSIKVMVNNQVVLSEVFEPSNSSGTGLVSGILSSPIIIENKEIITSLTYNTDMVGGNDHVRLMRGCSCAPSPHWQLEGPRSCRVRSFTHFGMDYHQKPQQ